jgi:hypothetical protein
MTAPAVQATSSETLLPPLPPPLPPSASASASPSSSATPPTLLAACRLPTTEAAPLVAPPCHRRLPFPLTPDLLYDWQQLALENSQILTRPPSPPPPVLCVTVHSMRFATTAELQRGVSIFKLVLKNHYSIPKLLSLLIFLFIFDHSFHLKNYHIFYYNLF